MATGGPFEPVEHDGVRYRIGQGNNVYCFPGIGLGIIASGARRVTDGMLLAAARAVAGEVGQSSLAANCVYPEMGKLHAVSRAVAQSVAETSVEEGIAGEGREHLDAEAITRRLDAEAWSPVYLPYRFEPETDDS